MQRRETAAAREGWLNELPIAALQLHAQECGIDVSSCIEKRDLVQRILESEPHEFTSGDADVQPVRDRQLSQAQADMQADEDFARRLQAEEEAQVRMAPHPGLRAGSALSPGHGGGNANSAARAQSLLSFISQALNEQPGRPPGPAASPGLGASPAHSPAASPGASPDRPSRLPPALGSPGAAGSSGPISAAGGPRSEERERAVAELLSGLAARRDARPKSRAAPPGASQGQGAGGDAEPPDVDVAAQALIGLLSQVLGNSDGRDPSGNNIAGMSALTELLGNLMPNQGIESAVVDSRTATMTYSAEADRGEARVEGAGGEERKCMVCLEEFKAADELRILPCLHRYHRECIDPWLALNRHCPVCKHDVTQ